MIHKLLDSQRIAALIHYLEAIEDGKQSTSEHRNLLISCYAKTKDEEKLRKLLDSTTYDINSHEMEGAIEGMSQNSNLDPNPIWMLMT